MCKQWLSKWASGSPWGPIAISPFQYFGVYFVNANVNVPRFAKKGAHPANAMVCIESLDGPDSVINSITM